ncbi:hypothetical protein E4U35_005186 [Claviceps purpurea]|nr:hypothetical protein E4U37_007293 [Claviceps purpurea]KAG6165449.1 hypothetical protein E4U11_000449 [Claviceps purpurea]KAG6180007.1 hypothetical protein E4U36_005198 [Claviceps purpurea]KAG6193312.1 hypothetical protein E4U27_000073 [Claviceps purpurea]KAG6210472.1 hypothetical protein E4U35_005186 [Claviceps purpurea]
MATPLATTAPQGSGSKKLEQITFRFCSECSNMLYPKEDEDAHALQFTCRTCQYTEEAQSTCVFRNVLNNSAGETAGVTQDVGSDPTVSQVPVFICSCCGGIILCGTCGKMATDLDATSDMQSEVKQHKESMGLCEFSLSWAGLEDPFDEYDEELMDSMSDGASLSSPSRSDSLSDTTDGPDFAENGAMIVAL